MKAYSLGLRERVVSCVNAGGSKVEAAKRFGVARKTVYNYLTLVQAGALAPKGSWGSWKKFEPARVREYVAQHPDATLWEIGYRDVITAEKIGKLSIVGVGMKSQTGVAGKLFETLANEGINIDMISTSEIKISVVIDLAKGEQAVKAVHAAFIG